MGILIMFYVMYVEVEQLVPRKVFGALEPGRVGTEILLSTFRYSVPARLNQEVIESLHRACVSEDIAKIYAKTLDVLNFYV